MQMKSFSFSVTEDEYKELQVLCPYDFPFDYKTFLEREKQGLQSAKQQGIEITPVKITVSEFATWCRESKIKPDNRARCQYALLVSQR